MRKAAAFLLGGVLIVTTVAIANARVSASRDAESVANSFMRKLDVQRPGADADFIIIPPQGNPAGFSNRKIAKFPTRGSHLSILSSGNVKAATRRTGRTRSATTTGGPSCEARGMRSCCG